MARRPLQSFPGPVLALSLLLASCGDDGPVPIADADTSTDVADAPSDLVEDPAVDPDASEDIDATELPDVPPDDASDAAEDPDGEDVSVPPLPTVLAPVDLAIEAGAETALVTTEDGLVVRVSLDTLQPFAVLAWGLSGPAGLAIESDGASALVAESFSGRLLRVELETGTVAVLTEGFDFPRGVALEPGGASALVADGTALHRVALSDGTVEVVSGVVEYGLDVVVETATSALVVEAGQVTRVDLASGSATPVVTEASVGASTFQGGLALSADGRTALVNTTLGCLATIDLASGASERLGCLFGSDQMAIAIEPGDRWAVLGSGGQIQRVALAPVVERVAASEGLLEWVAIETPGRSALALGGGPAVVYRLDLETGSLVPLAEIPTFTGASGLALVGDGTEVLTIGHGLPDNGGVSALLRVDLATGETMEITRDLSDCYGADLVLGSSDAFALIPCMNRLYRVSLSSGEVSVEATGVDIGGIALSADGTRALVSTLGGRELWRIDLPGGEPVRVGHDLFGPSAPGTGCTDVAIEAGGSSAILTQCGLYGAPYRDSGRVVRVDLATGALTVLVPGGLDQPGTFTAGTVGIAIEPGGATALVAETHRGITRVGLPTR